MDAMFAEKADWEPGHAASALGWWPLASCLSATGEDKSSFSMVWESQTWATVQAMRLDYAREKEWVVTQGQTACFIEFAEFF